jgi:carboxypeptidase C (cathepsin A)
VQSVFFHHRGFTSSYRIALQGSGWRQEVREEALLVCIEVALPRAEEVIGKDTNFLGARRWTSRLSWRRGGRYRRATTERWKVDALVLGYRRRGGGLTSLNVLNAGHLALRDQPRIAEALQQFMVAALRR